MPFYTLSVCLKLTISVTPVTEQPGYHSLLVKIPNSNNGNKNGHRNPLLVIHCHSYKKLVAGPWISLPFGCFLDLFIRGGQFETIYSVLCPSHLLWKTYEGVWGREKLEPSWNVYVLETRRMFALSLARMKETDMETLEPVCSEIYPEGCLLSSLPKGEGKMPEC